jgi:DNA repair exonuclease SbcCD ATPase subunit
MSRKSHSSIWLALISFPLVVEILASLLIISCFLISPLWILMLDESLNNFDLALFIYFFCAWLYAIFEFLKNGVSLPKSLLHWQIFVLRWIKDNPRRAVAFIGLILLVLLFSQKPEVKTNQSDLLATRLTNIENHLREIDSRAEETNRTLSEKLEEKRTKTDDKFSTLRSKFSVSPNSTQMPIDRNGIEELSSSFNYFLKYLSSRKNDTSDTSYSLDKDLGALNDSLKQISDIKNQAQTQCKFPDDREDAIECSKIESQIENIANQIKSTKRTLQACKQAIETIQSLDNSIYISPDLLALWEQKIEELKGKYQFDTKWANSWLFQATREIKDVRERMVELQQIHQRIQNDFQKVESSFPSISQQYKQVYSSLSERTENRELSLKDSNKIRENLSAAKQDNLRLSEWSEKISSLEESIQNSLVTVTDSSELYLITLRQLSGGGHSLSTQAKNNSLGNNYVDVILSKKQEIDDLYDEASTFNQEIKHSLTELKRKGSNIIGDIGELKSSLSRLQSRNSKVIDELKSAIIRSNLQVVSVVLVLILILVMLIWLQARMILLKKIKDIKTNLVKELIPKIKDSGESLRIRLYAIQILYNDVYSPTQSEVDMIKSTVKALEISSNINDRKVAAKLRNTADAIDRRLTEQRELQ